MNSPWPEVKLIASEDQVDLYESWLFGAGALSVTLYDPSASDDPAEAVLEPDPEEIRLWRRVGVTGLFSQKEDIPSIHLALQDSATEHAVTLPEYRIDTLADTHWERTWLDHFRPISFGQHLWIVPGTDEAPIPNAINLRLDPGLAFGTGTHPTTALCLEWLDNQAGELSPNSPRQALAGKRVLDFGCGSGILAIAALLLGAEEVVAVDIDPQAVQATRANAAVNGVEHKLRSEVIAKPDSFSERRLLENATPTADNDGTELADKGFDLLLANILHQPLMSLADTFSRLLRPGAELVMSGILESQVMALSMRYNPHFDILPGRQSDGWALVCARRKEV